MGKPVKKVADRELPDGLRVALLAFMSSLPLKQGLEVGLTCHAWLEVYGESVSNLVVGSNRKRVPSAPDLNKVLRRHSNLHTLTAYLSPGESHWQLPCAQLHHLTALSLTGGQFCLDVPLKAPGFRQLRSSDSMALKPLQQLHLSSCSIEPASLRHLQQLSIASLTKLQLDRVNMQQPQPLAQFTGLRRLELDRVNMQQRSSSEPAGSRLVGLLQPRTSLISLTLDHCSINPEGLLAALGSLQHLQALACSLPNSDTTVTVPGPQLLAVLPTSLTALWLSSEKVSEWCAYEDSRSRPVLSFGAAPQPLTRLTRLRHLELAVLTVSPSLLEGLTGLQHLSLEHVSVRDTAAADSDDFDDDDAAAAAAADAPHAFLANLGQLKQLQHLEVASCSPLAVLSGVSPYLLTCFAASTQLTALHIRASMVLPYKLLSASCQGSCSCSSCAACSWLHAPLLVR